MIGKIRAGGRSRNSPSAPRLGVIWLATMILMVGLGGFAPGSAEAQGGSAPPGYFTDCDKEKFEQLPQTAKEGILDESDREQQKKALDSAAGAVGANCTGDEDPTTANDLSEEDDPETQREAREQQQAENEDQTEEDEQSDEEYAQEGSLDEGGDDEGGGMVVGLFMGIIDFIAESLGEKLADQATKFLTGAAFSLPTPEGEIRNAYDEVSNIMKPGAVLLVLITGLMMTLRGTNYNTVYATQNALPKIVLFIAALAFFPQIMMLLSTWSEAFANAVLGTSGLDDAFQKVIRNSITPGSTIFTGIMLFASSIGLAGLVIVCVLKSFLFGVLYIVGPIAMFLYPISNLSGIASSWFKGVLACFLIPIVWVIEIKIGAVFIESPEILLGNMPGLGVYTAVMVVVLVYVMLKTPFTIIQYCFYGRTSENGIMGHLGRATLTATAIGVGRRAITGGRG